MEIRINDRSIPYQYEAWSIEVRNNCVLESNCVSGNKKTMYKLRTYSLFLADPPLSVPFPSSISDFSHQKPQAFSSLTPTPPALRLPPALPTSGLVSPKLTARLSL